MSSSIRRALEVSTLTVCGGAVGAGLVWIARGQLRIDVALIGWMVTFAGWFISARLSARSQRKMFLDGLINSARIDLINAIRSEQDWIRGVTGLGWKFQGEEHFRRLQPQSLQSDLQAAAHNRGLFADSLGSHESQNAR